MEISHDPRAWDSETAMWIKTSWDPAPLIAAPRGQLQQLQAKGQLCRWVAGESFVSGHGLGEVPMEDHRNVTGYIFLGDVVEFWICKMLGSWWDNSQSHDLGFAINGDRTGNGDVVSTNGFAGYRPKVVRIRKPSQLWAMASATYKSTVASGND